MGISLESSFYPPNAVFLPTEGRLFTHLGIVLLTTRAILQASKHKAFEIRHTRVRVFYSFNIINEKQRGGLCHPPRPLQEELESRPISAWIQYFVAVTTKPTEHQGFFLNGFPPATRVPPIYRTAQARHALDLRLVLQRICS